MLACDRQAEELLRSFWGDVHDGAPMPAELRGLAEGAQSGPPGVRRALTMERPGERLRIEVTAVGRGRTHLHLWRERMLAALQSAPPATVEGAGIEPPHVSDNLTQREREVALLVADGLRSREVAERLGIAAQTVKSHLKTIFDKLGVRNRVELARRLGA
ncbi:helix-turn-helix transcriptional regulator [Anaeromyxobacter paludicola]|uniref:helix-turn-helix transcriptional regulator n=1 Tax=Anaeromyxobacter paludicola TaxID=2918171 RepID=UPI0020BF3068|nr:LuxR C-terminal-related transcriptional regulator [Anaeromyxobacter paludicola]